MSRESYQIRRDAYEKIQIDKLAHENSALTIQLHDADVEVARLKLEVVQLANGQVELTARLQEEGNEIGRLSMVIARQRKSFEKMTIPKKKY